MNGIQEVSGSIPLISTKKHLISYEIRCFCNFFAHFLPIFGKSKKFFSLFSHHIHTSYRILSSLLYL